MERMLCISWHTVYLLYVFVWFNIIYISILRNKFIICYFINKNKENIYTLLFPFVFFVYFHFVHPPPYIKPIQHYTRCGYTFQTFILFTVLCLHIERYGTRKISRKNIIRMFLRCSGYIPIRSLYQIYRAQVYIKTRYIYAKGIEPHSQQYYSTFFIIRIWEHFG